MRKTIFYTIIGVLIATPSLYAQSESQLEKIRNSFQQLVSAYKGLDAEGNPIGFEEAQKIKVAGLKVIKTFDASMRGKYDVFLYLVEHIEYALDEEHKEAEACHALKNARSEFLAIDKKYGFISAKLIKKDYKENLGVTLEMVEAFYESDFCKHYQITKDSECPSLPEKTESKVAPPANPTEPAIPVQRTNPVSTPKPSRNIKTESGAQVLLDEEEARYITPDNEIYVADDAVTLLHRILSRNIFSTEYLEITTLVSGDFRWVPGVNGVPYEVKFKHSDTKKVMHFAPAEYIIPDNGEGDNFWEGYKKGINEFKDIVLTVLDDYGQSAFEIFIQGSADSPTFTPKPLVLGYDTQFFQEIHVLDINREEMKIVPRVIYVGTEHDNEELPDVRAAFIKFAIGRMDRISNYPNKLHILKGRVKNFFDPGERNVTIIIFIDWEAAGSQLLTR